MNERRAWAVVVGFVLAGLVAGSAAERAWAGGGARRAARKAGGGQKTQSMVVRYVSVRTGVARGRPTMFVVVAPLDSRRTTSLTVASKTEKGRSRPDPKIVSKLKQLKKGDLIRVSAGVNRGQAVLKDLEPYEPKPGEDDPMAFIFRESNNVKVGRQIYLVVTLEKLGRETKVFVPNKRGADGKMESDLELTMKVAECKRGQLVEVETSPSGRMRFLKYIGPYVLPIQGKFVKVAEEKTDGGTKASIEVEVDGETKSVPVMDRGRGDRTIPDARVVAAAKRFKTGDLVDVKTRKQGDQAVAIRITKADPTKPRPKPEPVKTKGKKGRRKKDK